MIQNDRWYGRLRREIVACPRFLPGYAPSDRRPTLIRGSTAHFLIRHSPIETSLDSYQNTSFSEFENPEGVLSLQVSLIVCSGNTLSAPCTFQVLVFSR